jgi:type IV pilus assembly protein PilE
MIVCALMAVLLSLAVPAYQRYLLRAHRSTAIESLLSAAACQERIYASSFHYDTNRCLAAGGDDYYDVRFEPTHTAAANTFVIIAEPVRAQTADVCGTLSLDQSGKRAVSGPAEHLRACWEGR